MLYWAHIVFVVFIAAVNYHVAWI